MSVLGYIPDDGYTEAGILFEKAHLYPRLAFRFRPMTIAELVEYDKAADQLKGAQLRRLAARCLSSHIKTWDLKAQDGTVLPIDDATMLRLKDVLFNRLFNIITTQGAPDAAPEHSESQEDQLLQDALKAIDAGRSPQSIREEREQKN